MQETLCSEVTFVHQCLRVEVTELARLVSEAYSNPELREQATEHFEALRSIYESHSKAEDEILFPEFRARGLADSAHKELDKQHDRQSVLFERLKESLQTWSETSIALADELKSSIILHLKLEEEEILPVLGSEFRTSEVGALVGKVMGDRSSEVMQEIIRMLARNFPPAIVDKICAEFTGAAANTNFKDWLESVRQQEQQSSPPKVPPATRSLGCSHQRRSIKIWALCCQDYFTCSVCHDEKLAAEGKPPHSMVITSPVRALCMVCETPQENPSVCCVNCSQPFARYCCPRCGVWEDDPNVKVYHCPYCNVCRLGEGLGKDFFHCMRCNACVSTSMRFHKCVEGSLARNCPLCCESLLSPANKSIQYIPCGHLIHQDCFKHYLSHDYRCATCRASMIDMKATWAAIDELVAAEADQVPPSEFVGMCNDCGMGNVSKCGTVSRLVELGQIQLHVGEKCHACGSYNTG